VIFYLLRIGGGTVGTEDDPNDGTDAVAVARNLSVSALADADPDRAPRYQRP
jgi:hypothetical protein